MSQTVSYDRRTIMLHWLTGGIIVAMWGLAQIIDWFPNALRVYPRSTHIVLGLALIAVFVTRIVWRNTGGRRLPAADSGALHVVAKATHWGLYALIAVTLGLGLYFEAVRADNIFNLFRLPSISPGNKPLRDWLGDWHGTAANAILILAGLHAAAALFHHYYLKDGLLGRMLSSR